MGRSFWLGIEIISVSAVLNGTFALPMKYSRRWRWENTWLFFSLLSLIVMPWILAVDFVPNLWTVYAVTPVKDLLFPLGFGLLLGIAQVTYGLGIASVGIAVAIAVVCGVSSVSGALVPLMVLQPEDLLRPQGLLLLLSMPVLAVGLVFYSRAGHRRENEQAEGKQPVPAFPWGFGAGLAICIFTGIFGSSMNLGFAFSGRIIRNSMMLGGDAATSTYAVWALLFGASFIPILVYCSYLLFRDHGWSLFFGATSTKEIGLSTGMAVLQFGANIGYGIGATAVGKYGTSVGWALFAAVTIIASNLSGIMVGEWKNTSRQTHRLLLAAVVVLLLSAVPLVLTGWF